MPRDGPPTRGVLTDDLHDNLLNEVSVEIRFTMNGRKKNLLYIFLIWILRSSSLS